MIATEATEVKKLIEGSPRILMTTKVHPGFDEIASLLAWSDVLRQRPNATVDAVAEFPEKGGNRFKFLPGFSLIQSEARSTEHFIIRVDVKKTKVKELSYDLKDAALEIHVTPRGGNFKASDVSFAKSDFAYDLIMVMGAAELPATGSIFSNNRELFFNTPIINIDRQSANVRFGQVNAIYLTATSLAEISYAFLKDSLNHNVATCLLTGLIAATKSFQTPQVTPETLELASKLIVAGASREDIVTRLYRTKDMDRLKIWGKILSRLQHVDERIVYSYVSEDDIHGKDLDLAGLSEELVLTSPESHIVIFFAESRANETRVFVYGRENYDLPLIYQKYNPLGTRREVQFTLREELRTAEQAVLDHTRQQLKTVNY